ncbi:MAG: OmpA family protein [Candidatus Omnitrophica bacterium]|nr:OmpA family protein [Candidatus Omnitrophota bacterium]
MIPSVRFASRFCFFAFIAAFAFTGSGCAKNKDLEKVSREQAATIQSLSNEIKRLNDELDQAIRSREDLAKAKEALEDKLRKELGTGDFALSMQDRGLVLTVQNKVLFDSGKNELKNSSKAALAKISVILKEKVGQNQVNIEGHTDNVPIRASNWKSNWELSTARATEVIHFFIDDGGLNPERFAAVGYGEFHPVASNDDAASRGLNRRVDIVISPKKINSKS